MKKGKTFWTYSRIQLRPMIKWSQHTWESPATPDARTRYRWSWGSPPPTARSSTTVSSTFALFYSLCTDLFCYKNGQLKINFLTYFSMFRHLTPLSSSLWRNREKFIFKYKVYLPCEVPSPVEPRGWGARALSSFQYTYPSNRFECGMYQLLS